MPLDDPSLPNTWLIHAKSDLLLSKLGDREEILFNQLCFHAQQSAEKSLKAVLIKYNVDFEFTHNIKNLISSLPTEIERPDFFKDLTILTDYAVSTRYPGDYEEILLPEYEKAISLAQQAFDWAEDLIRK
ncbi:HEPN domain-containing protein [Leptospira sp. 201903070]|uniref:HEPN domain-containing protein n=1 Tax=Leptospira ainlahdjerensis TaxID=2810033 RepID=A0ABS2UGG3_9LEPT|nr:HEPN domain-containing protein [Leptospira ainlahdjerensis]MBM9578648.1 HEPN domain-containing protein [Leptospira ainlahdjerensis]